MSITTTPGSAQTSALGAVILLELNRSKHIYEGTVAPATVAKRRAANKRARAQRRINRRRAA